MGKKKTIWKEFLETSKAAAIDAYEALRKVAKETFKLFKTVLIDTVAGLFKYIYALASGVAEVIYNLLKVVGAALASALKATIEHL